MKRQLVVMTMMIGVPSSPAIADELTAYRTHSGAAPPTHDWISIEAPIALGAWSGAVPGVSLYRDNGVGALGARLRAGVLTRESLMGTDARDVLVTAQFAMRRRIGRAWLELGGGAGATRHGVAPTIDAGAGWVFELADIEVSPSIRYFRLEDRDPERQTIGTVLVGLELHLLRSRNLAARDGVAAPRERGRLPDLDRLDRASDYELSELQLAQAMLAGYIEVTEELISVDTRLLFDASTSGGIHDIGRNMLEVLARHLRRIENLSRVEVRAHSNSWGTEEQELAMTQRWADLASGVLKAHGVPPKSIESVGLGRDTIKDEQHRSRVELRIERHRQ